jgi:hypothetical protein
MKNFLNKHWGLLLSLFMIILWLIDCYIAIQHLTNPVVIGFLAISVEILAWYITMTYTLYLTKWFLLPFAFWWVKTAPIIIVKYLKRKK